MNKRRILHKSDWTTILVITVVAIILIVWLYYYVVTNLIVQDIPRTPGAFGDMFGLLAVIVSGLALGGVVATGWMQYRSIEGDRAERLREHYFALLDRAERSISRLSVEIDDKHFTGHSALIRIAEELIKQVEDLGDENLIIEVFDQIYDRYAFHLSTYFKNQNYILRFVKESDLVSTMLNLDGTDSDLTLNLYKSQLTKEELQLTFYNVLSRSKREDERDIDYVDNARDFKILSGLQEKYSSPHLPDKHIPIYEKLMDKKGHLDITQND